MGGFQTPRRRRRRKLVPPSSSVVAPLRGSQGGKPGETCLREITEIFGDFNRRNE